MSAVFDKICKNQRGDRFVDPDPRDFLQVLTICGRGSALGLPTYYVTDDDNHSRWVSERRLNELDKLNTEFDNLTFRGD